MFLSSSKSFKTSLFAYSIPVHLSCNFYFSLRTAWSFRLNLPILLFSSSVMFSKNSLISLFSSVIIAYERVRNCSIVFTSLSSGHKFFLKSAYSMQVLWKTWPHLVTLKFSIRSSKQIGHCGISYYFNISALVIYN